jgi:pimeloyl-ACP methyl ester carboxylesterase
MTLLPSGAALHAAGPARSPLLFLHGVGGGAWSWQPQADALSHDHRTYAWEARGHGNAARVADAGLSDYHTDAREALTAICADGDEPVTLVGHSMGGLLAIALACERPRDVAGLFLVDPVYATGQEYGHFSPRAGRIALWFCEPLLRSFATNGRVSRAISRWMFEHSFEDARNMEAAWPHQRAQVPIEYPRMLRESFGLPTGFELRDFAEEIACPAYLLEGSAGLRTPRFPALCATLERRLGERFTHAAIPGGHYLQLDRPAEVTERLASFVRRMVPAT